MADKQRISRLGRILTTIGYVWFALIFLGPVLFPGLATEALSATFFPALITIFAGRAANRRAKRRPMEEVEEASKPVEKPRPEVSRPRPPTPRPEPAKPSRAKIDSDLEKVLAPYRADSEQADGEDIEGSSLEIASRAGDFRPKTSAEMIEEARRRFNKSD